MPHALDTKETEELRHAEFKHFLWAADNETDRGLVLSSSAYLEIQVERITQALLGRNPHSNILLRNDGPLGTFSSRINLCTCFLAISEFECKALKLISNIRNDFAHRLLIDFEAIAIRDKATELAKHVLAELDKGTRTKLIAQGGKSCFIVSSFIISDRLKIRDTLIDKMQNTHKFDFISMNDDIQQILDAAEKNHDH